MTADGGAKPARSFGRHNTGIYPSRFHEGAQPSNLDADFGFIVRAEMLQKQLMGLLSFIHQLGWFTVSQLLELERCVFKSLGIVWAASSLMVGPLPFTALLI